MVQILDQERNGPTNPEGWQLPLKGRFPELKPEDKKLIDVPDYLVRIQLEITSEKAIIDRLMPKNPTAHSAIALATIRLAQSVYTGDINEEGLRKSITKEVDKATVQSFLRARSNIGILNELFSFLNKNYSIHGFTHDLPPGCSIDIRFDEKRGRLVYIEKLPVKVCSIVVTGRNILVEDFADTGLTRPLSPKKPTVTVAESTLAEGEIPVLQGFAQEPLDQSTTSENEDSNNGALNKRDLRLTPLFGPNSSWQPDPNNPEID